jgi:hypothetical protein
MEPIVERVDLLIDLRKPYEKPEIIQELELETRAGSPNPTQVLFDPFDNE